MWPLYYEHLGDWALLSWLEKCPEYRSSDPDPVCVWDWEKLSAVKRCPLYRGVCKGRFHCTLCICESCHGDENVKRDSGTPIDTFLHTCISRTHFCTLECISCPATGSAFPHSSLLSCWCWTLSYIMGKLVYKYTYVMTQTRIGFVSE